MNLGKLGLFIGIESFTWKQADWVNAAAFMQQNGVDFAVIKVFDGPTDWFSDASAFMAVSNIFNLRNIQVLPYGFMYGYSSGSNLLSELALVQKYMQLVGLCCGDIEGGAWSNHADWGQIVAQQLQGVQGNFYASVPANPVDASQVVSFQPMVSVVKTFMPMAYSPYLFSVYQAQWAQVGANLNLAPTLDLSTEFDASNNPLPQAQALAGVVQTSLWEYQFAQSNIELLDQISEVIHMGIPAGWSDDGTSLHNPVNSFVVQKGFRQYVLANSWNKDDVPLENEFAASPLEENNPALGSGTAQNFRFSRLEWEKTSNVVIKAGLGVIYEYMKSQRDSLQTELNTVKSDIGKLLVDFSTLQTDVTQLKTDAGA